MARSDQQVQRMLALVPYLNQRGGIPVGELAAEFGVTVRQLHKDLALLMNTGVGEYHGELVDIDQFALEADGTVIIRDADFMERPLRLNGREGVALVVALRTLRASAAGDQLPIIDSALAKLESTVSQEVDAPVDVHVEQVDPVTQQNALAALQRGRRLELTYAAASTDGRSQRLVDPIRVFTERGNLYLEAWCLTAEDLRFFRLDRVLEARVTDTPAEDHDAVPRTVAEFPVGEDTPRGVFDLAPAARWFTEYYQVEDAEERPDGVLRVTVYGGSQDWLRRLALRNATGVTVVAPPELVADVREHARRALAAYDGQ